MSLHGQCIFCDLAFTPGTVAALPCGHPFHAKCIKPWLNKRNHPGCPTCRGKYVAKDVIPLFFDNDDESDVLNRTTKELEVQTKRISELKIRVQHLENEKRNLKNAEEILRAENGELQDLLNDVTAEASGQGEELEKLKTYIANDKKPAKEIAQLLHAEKEKSRKLNKEAEVRNKRISQRGIGVSQQRRLSCNCVKGCATNHCTCRKNGLPCDSRCHSATGCKNKSCSAGNHCAQNRYENTAPSSRRF